MSELVWGQGRVDTSSGSVNTSDTSSIITEITDIPLGSFSLVLPYVAIYFRKVSNNITTDVSYSSIKRYIFLYDKNNNYLGYQQISNEAYEFVDNKFVKARKFIFECYYDSSSHMYPSEPQSMTGTYYYMVYCSFYFNTKSFHYENDIWISDESSSIDHKTIELPLPLAYWRIDSQHNNGYPYHERLGDISYVPPAPVYSIKPEKQIQVYEYTTTQEDLLSKNGAAILFPESCTSRHELNGRWDITLTHKIDKLKKWEYLKFENILKVSGQLFRIDTQQTQIDYDKELITVHANHIFYDLNQRLVEKETWVSDNVNVAAQTFWTLLSERPMPQAARDYWAYELESDSRKIPVLGIYNSTNPYIFTKILSSDYQDVLLASTEHFNKTVVDLLIGSDGFINRWGGEIYRNNFYFSLNPTIEDCEENSFFLRFPIEINSISEKKDVNSFTTVMSIYDKNGNYAGGTSGNVPEWLHHHRPTVTQIDMTYTDKIRLNLWEKHRVIDEEINIEFNEPKYNPQFKDKKIAVPRYHVGDKGYIMIQGQKEPYRITAVERDEITKDFISITFKKID